MAGPTDLTDVAERLELLGAGADFVRANAEREGARLRVVRLARRIVRDATLTDAEVVRAATAIATKTLGDAQGALEIGRPA